jgi:hypothetical protein
MAASVDLRMIVSTATVNASTRGPCDSTLGGDILGLLSVLVYVAGAVSSPPRLWSDADMARFVPPYARGAYEEDELLELAAAH